MHSKNELVRHRTWKYWKLSPWVMNISMAHRGVQGGLMGAKIVVRQEMGRAAKSDGGANIPFDNCTLPSPPPPSNRK